MMERKEGIVNKLTSGIQGLFKLNKVKSIQGTAKVVSANQVEVTNGDNKEIIEGKKQSKYCLLYTSDAADE